MRTRAATRTRETEEVLGDLSTIAGNADKYREEELAPGAAAYRAPDAPFDQGQHFSDRPGPADGDDRAMASEVHRRQDDAATFDRLGRIEVALERVEEGLANAQAVTVFEAHLVETRVEVAADARIAVLLVAAWSRETARSTKTPDGAAVLRVLELERKAQILEERVGPVTDEDRVAVEALREAVGE